MLTVCIGHFNVISLSMLLLGNRDGGVAIRAGRGEVDMSRKTAFKVKGGIGNTVDVLHLNIWTMVERCYGHDIGPQERFVDQRLVATQGERDGDQLSVNCNAINPASGSQGCRNWMSVSRRYHHGVSSCSKLQQAQAKADCPCIKLIPTL